MATTPPATFRTASDFMVLFMTLENLAATALEKDSDPALQSTLIWTIQKLSETAAKESTPAAWAP